MIRHLQKDCSLYRTKNSSKVTINANFVNNTVKSPFSGDKTAPLAVSFPPRLSSHIGCFREFPKWARIGNSFLVLPGCPFGRYDLYRHNPAAAVSYGTGTPSTIFPCFHINFRVKSVSFSFQLQCFYRVKSVSLY